MSKKERVLELKRLGITDVATISETLNIPRRTVYRYISDNKAMLKLNVKTYIKVVKNGYDTKDDLLKQFKVSKKTLLQFERDSGILALLAKIEYIQGKSYNEIGEKLHLRLNTIDNFNITQLPTIKQIKNELSQILDVYDKMAEVDDSFVAKTNVIKSIIQKL